MSRSKREPGSGKSPVRLVAPREPSQERSRVRYQALLDAAAKLVEERDFADIGLYDISERAGIPPGSVYHFFPTKESAFVALARRYLDGLAELLKEPVELDGVNGWQDLLEIRYARVISYYNAHSAFARIALSGSTISEIRKLDADFLAHAENTPLGLLDSYLEMPFLPDAAHKFSCLVGIYDGIWVVSYSRHGRITEAFAREGLRAGIGYCRTFLPEVIPFRAIAAAPTHGDKKAKTRKSHP